MQVLAVIPARYQSTRLKNKMLVDISGKPLIQRTYENCTEMPCLNKVLVATDHPDIEQAVLGFGGEVQMTADHHESGSDRIAEAIEHHPECSLIVNIQGDEPLIATEDIENLVAAFEDPLVDMATLAHPMSSDHAPDPNQVKVIFDRSNYAIYFSRSVIPYSRDEEQSHVYHKHIGIYAYRRDKLLEFVNLGHSSLEKSERLEQLRALEHGLKIKIVLTDNETIGVDTQEDVDKLIAYYEDN